MHALNTWINSLTARRGARAPLALLALAALLFLPLLGHDGLWDPAEVRIADVAKEMAHGHSWIVPARAPGPHTPLLYWALSAGYRVGAGELAGRLPVAVLSLLAVLAAWYAAAGLLRRRAAFLGTFALVTTPAVFLGARALNTHVDAMLTATLAVGGLARLARPGGDEEQGGGAALHFALALVGLGLGFYAQGLLLGVAVPIGAVAVALLVTGDRRAGVLRPVLSIAALLAAGAAIFAWWRGTPGGGHPGYSALLGGSPRPSVHSIELTTLLKTLGFGAFPWIALAPLAVVRIFGALGEEEQPDRPRDDYGRLVLLAWLLLAYFAQTLFHAGVSEQAHFGAWAAIALLAGLWLDELWEAREFAVVAGLFAIIGAALLAHDYLMFPESWAGAHVLDGIKWPTPAGGERVFLGLRIPTALTLAPQLILFVGLVWGALVALACAVRPDGLSPEEDAATGPGVLGGLAGRQSLLAGSLLAALVAAAGTVYWVIPEVSQHLSYKGLFNKYKSLVGTGNSEIGKYRVPGQLSEYGKTTEIASLPQMFEFLAKRERVFVIAAADELPAIDQYARSHAGEEKVAANYYVVDDTNSKFLMISNQLGAEKDLNPLRRFVLKADGPLPKAPQFAASADFEGKIELLGYDVKPEIDRGAEFTITMYYKVKQAVPAGYKVFIHFDGPGTRFNGDHVPLEGRFPTNYWVPGSYIIDEHKVVAERAMAPAGTYFIYTGFWLGDSRLKVTSGPNDGDQRVKLGAVRVK